VKTDPTLVSVLKGAKIIEIDDTWAGANRQRIVERWVNEVLPAH
jgi:iron(III) transport system substrate-binding protein